MSIEKWHLDKKIQTGTLIVYTITAVWYASALNSRVAAIEVKQQNGITAFERLIRLETNVDNLKDAIGDIKTSMLRIDDNIQKIADKKK